MNAHFRSKFRLILVGCLITIALVVTFSQIIDQRNREPKYVFFDLGANIGDSAQMFVDVNFDSKHPLKGYAAKDNKKWILHSFEANPVHNEKLDATKKLVESLGHTQYVYKQTAAWIKDEIMTFYLDKVNNNTNYWGSSLHKEHDDAKKSGYANIQVKAFDISRMLKEYNEHDFIVLKMDIEGSEFAMLDHLVRDGSIYWVDIITIEFHRIFKKGIEGKQEVEETVQFFKQFFTRYNIQYYPWYLGHRPFHQ